MSIHVKLRNYYSMAMEKLEHESIPSLPIHTVICSIAKDDMAIPVII